MKRNRFKEVLYNWHIKLIVMSLEDFQEEILLREIFVSVNERS